MLYSYELQSYITGFRM